MIGIYKITSPKKKVYIGQSSDIEKRKNIYKKYRCKGQLKLYNSLKKYGFNNHKFDVLLECEISELNDKERYFQDLYSSIGKMGLNLKLTKATDRKCQISEETKLKISTANKIANAKKRGDYDSSINYSIYTKKIKLNKNKDKHIIYFKDCKAFFPLTREYFSTTKTLYEAHKDKFSTYRYALKIANKNNHKSRYYSFD